MNTDAAITDLTVMTMIDSVEIEAVIAGAFMRVTFTPGTNPAHVPHILRELDSACIFRDSFPVRGGGGSRPTLAARALVITAESRGDSTFIKITAHAEDGDDISISVPRKKTTDFVPSVEALGKLSEKTLGKLRGAIEGKKAVTVILQEAEQFTVRYWKSDDSSYYLDSVEA